MNTVPKAGNCRDFHCLGDVFCTEVDWRSVLGIYYNMTFFNTHSDCFSSLKKKANGVFFLFFTRCQQFPCVSVLVDQCAGWDWIVPVLSFFIFSSFPFVLAWPSDVMCQSHCLLHIARVHRGMTLDSGKWKMAAQSHRLLHQLLHFCFVSHYACAAGCLLS